MTDLVHDKTAPTISELVREDFRTASVFKKHGLDFCCGGKTTLDAACLAKGIDVSAVEADLELAVATLPAHDNYNEWELDRLVQHIIDQHHSYVRKAVPELRAYTARVAEVHGERNPQLVSLYHHFEEVSAELMMHMQKEEMILFPFIRDIATAARNNASVSPPPFGTLQNPINMMEAEHESAGDVLKLMREETNGFTPPANACNTWRVTYEYLAEFESDLFRHIHLENNILFPKAIELERTIVES